MAAVAGVTHGAPTDTQTGTVPFVAAAVERLVHPILSTAVAAPRDSFHEGCASAELRAALGARVGNWITVSRSSARQTDASESFLIKLIEASEGAEICAPTPNRKSGNLPSLHLPTNILEHLKATPGRSIVMVALADTDGGTGGELPLARRVVVARVYTPDMKRQYRRALCSFFCVPRVLKEGEVFYIPFQGLPPQLQEIEEGGAIGSYDSPDDSGHDETEQGNDWTDAFKPGLRQSAKQHLRQDTAKVLAFQGMLGFQVKSIDTAAVLNNSQMGPDRRTRCFLVDRRSSELLVQGACSSRGLPYIAGHLFCKRPQALPLSLQSPFERLLGLLAPAIRRWEQPNTAIAQNFYSVLVTGARGCGKRLLWNSVCERLGLHLLEINCFQLASQGATGVEDALQRLMMTAAENSPVVICLRRLQALTQSGPSLSPSASLLLQRRLEASLVGALQQANEPDEVAASQAKTIEQKRLLILAGTCEVLDDLAGPIRKVFQVELKLDRPDENARRAAIAQLLPLYEPQVRLETSADALAKLTAGLSYTDLRSVCNEVALLKHPPPGKDHPLSEEERIEQAVKRLQGGSKVAVTLASKVNWADIGGLEGAKDEIMNCITLPLTQGHMFAGQKTRSGVLLFGPPGTGKTLLAKAVATECHVHFLSVKGPELLSMYIGESEKNVRSLFQSARELQPCVLFFDELDSLAPARGRGSDSGGVMDRVVSQLLTELDALPATVFLIGATNRPDLLDRSLLRPGRLDRMVYLGVAKDKLPLLRAVTRKFDLEDAGNGSLLESVAKHCAPNFTGADIAALCQDAYSIAQKEHIKLLDSLANKLGVSVSTMLLFLEALDKKVASIKSHDAGKFKVAAHTCESCLFSFVFAQGAAGEPGKCALENLPLGLSLFHWCGPRLDRHQVDDRQTPVYLIVLHTNTSTDMAVCLPSGGPAVEAAGKPESNGIGSRINLCTTLQKGDSLSCARCKSWLSARSSGGGMPSVCGLCPLNALQVLTGWRHFQESLKQLQPSVPMEDLQRYEQLAKEYENTKK